MSPTPLPRDVAAELLGRLIRLRAKGPTEPLEGICFNVDPAAADADFGYPWLSALEGLFARLGLDPTFPVRLPGWRRFQSQREYLDTNDLWSRDTEYGRARWKLLDDLIATLRDDLGCDTVNVVIWTNADKRVGVACRDRAEALAVAKSARHLGNRTVVIEIASIAAYRWSRSTRTARNHWTHRATAYEWPV